MAALQLLTQACHVGIVALGRLFLPPQCRFNNVAAKAIPCVSVDEGLCQRA